VNLSPRSLHDRHLPRDVAALLERHHVPADRLVLEITETVVLSSDRVVDEVLGELRQLGAQLAVDDFGTGCSALTFLTRVPVDEVKIDRTFVTRMVDSPEAAAIVRTTVELARELGLRVVAEGVESAEQRAALMALSCPSAQGFHFYATMNADRMLDVAREAAALAAAEAAAAAAAMAAAAEAAALLAAEAAAAEADGRRVRRLRAAE
jgi:diguanylate cyclase